MGRTVPTMTQLVQSEEDLWAPFRRALRAEDRVAFDRLFAAARHYAAVASYAARPVPFEAILLSMLLEAMKAIQHLETEITALRADPSAGRADLFHGLVPAAGNPGLQPCEEARGLEKTRESDALGGELG